MSRVVVQKKGGFGGGGQEATGRERGEVSSSMSRPDVIRLHTIRPLILRL